MQFSCLCSFKRDLLQSWSSVACWGSFIRQLFYRDSFDHVMDFSLTFKSAVFGVRDALRTRCSCMSMFAEVCAFSFVARSDSMRWVLHNVMCIEMLHYELCACSGTTGDMMTYVIWCLSSFSFSLRSVAQTQTFAGVLQDAQVHMSALLTTVLFSRWPIIDLLNLTSWEVY